MNAIVVYYSLEGNTDHAAKMIAEELNADLLRLETVEPYATTGFKKFLRGGKEAMQGATPALKPYTFDPEAYDTVILGTPLWAWHFAPPVRTFQKEQNVKGKKLGFFVTSMGGQDKKCLAAVKSELSAENAPELSLIEPLRQQKPENRDKIRAFAEQIRNL